jgi:hypothetical protein
MNAGDVEQIGDERPREGQAFEQHETGRKFSSCPHHVVDHVRSTNLGE